jgi:two-component system sensor histidine kinase HydH
MNERRQRRWRFWAGKWAIAMAVIVAVSLSFTVLVAERALHNASDVVIQGDGQALGAGVITDLLELRWPVTSDALAPVLARHAALGLRYVALVDRRDHHVIAAAGTPAFAKSFEMPGDVERKGPRVRLTDALARLYARREGAPEGRNDAGAWEGPLDPRPYLVLEFESAVIRGLDTDLRWISVVAAGAALVLVTFAFAWSRTTARLAVVQEQAERERRLVALGRASSVIAHELRNPLAALKGHAQLLVEDLAEPSRAKATRVVEGAERLERLTSVLLDFVRDGPLEVRVVTPAELVDRALAEVPRDRVRVDLSRAPEALHVDPDRASLALRNLVQNAVQATPEDADAVEVRIDASACDVTIEVRDHGPGLAPEAAAHMFDPFVTTKARGTGLGLSIARRIAEQHRGTLTGETHGEGGAVFRLVLPAKP